MTTMTRKSDYQEAVESYLDMIPALSALIADELLSQFRRVLDDDNLVYDDELELKSRVEIVFETDPRLQMYEMCALCNLEHHEIGKIMWLKNKSVVVEYVFDILKANSWKLEIV